MKTIVTTQRIIHRSMFDDWYDCTEITVRCRTTDRIIWSKKYYDEQADELDARLVAKYLANGRRIVELPTMIID